MIAIYFAIFCLVASLFLRQKVVLNLLALISLAYYFGLISFQNWNFQLNLDSLYLYLLSLLGLLLLMIELYIPSFGLVGLIGLIFYSLSIYFTLGELGPLILMMIGNMGFAFLVFIIFLRLDYSINVPQVFVLQQSHQKDLGYQSRDNQEDLLGLSGIAVTPLRPVGRGRFESKQSEVISKEGFIEEGRKIKVVEVSNGSVYVREEIKNG